MPRITDKKIIKDFLTGKGTDHLGRTLPSYWDCDDNEMEKCHDRIQFMFPLHEDSKMTKNFPIITEELVDEMEADGTIKEARENMVKSAEFFLKFLGITNDISAMIINGVQSYYSIKGNWLRDGDHNLLRITRMIRSLRLFDLDAIAIELYGHFKLIGESADINQRTLDFWRKAAFGDKWETIR